MAYLQLKRKKKRNKKRKLQRDALTYEEFQMILRLIESDSYDAARNFLAFLILYVTGVRAANLCFFTIRHLREMIEVGSTSIEIVKNDPTRHMLHLSSKDLRL